MASVERTETTLYIEERPMDVVTVHPVQTQERVLHVSENATAEMKGGLGNGPMVELEVVELRPVGTNATAQLSGGQGMGSESVTMTTMEVHHVDKVNNNNLETSSSNRFRRFGSESVTAEVRRGGKSQENFTAHGVKRRAVSEINGGSPERPPVTLKEGKCSCCPYGYHIDLDFLRYCDSMSNGKQLKQLKRIQREKRKLRKSMEIYLQQQEQANKEGRSTTEVKTFDTDRFLNMTDYQDSATSQLLDEIDSSVDATLSSIDVMMSSPRPMNFSSDSDRSSSPMSPPGSRKFNTFPRKAGQRIVEELAQMNVTLSTAGRTDSSDTVSSVSTLASERSAPAVGYTNVTNINNELNMSKFTTVTSEQLAATMATHLPVEDDTSPNLSRASLQAIREAMAISLQRMRELEEQVKAIPVLQVRLSVLKEEKRLLMLQLKAKSGMLNTRSIGVGVDFSPVISPSAGSFDFPDARRLKSPPPATPPKPRVKFAAVGDHSVLEPYLVQPDLPSSYTIKDNEEHITSTHVYEKETVYIDRDKSQSLFSPPKSPHSPKPLTRTVGVGDGNVADESGLRVHEKELRTVIIGQNVHVGKRNVGVDCRVPTRDVGVSYCFDVEKPSTRSVGVMVDTGALLASVSFKTEEMRTAIREVLSKNVRSVGLMTDMRPATVDKGVQFAVSAWNVRSIGVGDCNIDVEVRHPVPKRSISVDAQPVVMNRSVNTDYGWKLDATTNTSQILHVSKAIQYDAVRTYTRPSQTDTIGTYQEGTQTDMKIFVATDQLKHTGINTYRGLLRTVGMNTDSVPMRTIGVSDDRLDSFVCSFDEEKSDELTEVIEKFVTVEVGGSQSDHQQAIHAVREMREGGGYGDISRWSSSSEGGGGYSSDRWRAQEDLSRSHETVDMSQKQIAYEMSPSSSDRSQGYQTVREYSSPTLSPQIQDKSKSDEGETVLTVQEKVTQISEDGQNWEDFSRSQELIEEKLLRETSGEGDYMVSTWKVTRKIGAGPDGETVVEETKTLSGAPDMQTSATIFSNTAAIAGGDFESGTTKERSALLKSELEFLGSGSKVYGTKSFSDHDMHALSAELGESGMTTRMVTTVTETGSDGTVYVNRYADDHGGMLGHDESSRLKSIMKKSKSDTQVKKGISFAETVVGGYTSSSDGEGSESESDTTSYDEGSYDGREGSITYSCRDDEAIAQGLPGAKMFDQNIRETYELSQEMISSCEILSNYLEDSTTVQTKQLNASLNVIQQEWFKISGEKLSNPHQVEDFLSSFNEISKRLLEYIVNIQDANGNTAIHYAVTHGNFEIVSLLLDTGLCDLNKQNKAGYTAIIMGAVSYLQTDRQHEVIRRLFHMGDVNARASKDGSTALMQATIRGNTSMVRMLLEARAEVNVRDFEGSTALMCACEHGHTDIVKVLLAHPDIDANLADNDGSTALSIAMEAGNKDIGVLLYAHLNFSKANQSSPAFMRKRKTSSNPSPLPSPTIR